MNIINKRAVWLWGRGTTMQKGLLVKVALLKLHCLQPVGPGYLGSSLAQISGFCQMGRNWPPGGKAAILVANTAGFFYK